MKVPLFNPGPAQWPAIMPSREHAYRCEKAIRAAWKEAGWPDVKTEMISIQNRGEGVLCVRSNLINGLPREGIA